MQDTNRPCTCERSGGPAPALAHVCEEDGVWGGVVVGGGGGGLKEEALMDGCLGKSTPGAV